MTIYVFDMDGTLTPARKVMTDEFAQKFLPWLKSNKAFIATGSDFAKIEDIAVITISNMLPDGHDYCNKLKKEGRKPYLVSMHTVKPLDKEIILEFVNKGVEIQTLEEHSIIGSLGSAVAEVIAESGKGIKFKRIGVPDKFSHYIGSRDFIKKQFGLYYREGE